MPLQTRLSQLGVATIIAGVISLSAFLPGAVRPSPPPEPTRRALFDDLVREEPPARKKARDEWAQHRWSQQDAFGAHENSWVTRVASERAFFAQDLFLLIDDGIRAGWPGPDGQPLEIVTVPLKPRSMD